MDTQKKCEICYHHGKVGDNRFCLLHHSKYNKNHPEKRMIPLPSDWVGCDGCEEAE